MNHSYSEIPMQNLLSRILVHRAAFYRLALVVTVAAFGLALPGCHGKKTSAPSAADAPIVRLMTKDEQEPRTIERIVGQPSFVEAYERTSIFPKMTGYIYWKWDDLEESNKNLKNALPGMAASSAGYLSSQLVPGPFLAVPALIAAKAKKNMVDIGDKVKKNQVLARIDVPELEAKWQTKKEMVGLMKEQIDLALKVVKVSEADVKTAAARVLEAKALVKERKADVKRWEIQVVRLTEEVKRGVVNPMVLAETERQLESSQASVEGADANVLKADADLLAKEAKKIQDDISVSVARANLRVAVTPARLERFNQFGRALAFVVLMAAYCWGRDLKVIEQLLCLASVFACNPVDSLEHVEGAQSNVAQVADGGCHQVEAGCQSVLRIGVIRHVHSWSPSWHPHARCGAVRQAVTLNSSGFARSQCPPHARSRSLE